MSEKFESVFGKRIVGAKGKEERVKAKKELEEDFLKGEGEITPYEIPKTERDKEIIKQAENSVDDFIKLVSGDPKPLGEKRIHFLKPGGVYALTEGRTVDGVYFSHQHSLVIDRTSSDVETVLNLQHELLHLKGKTRLAIEKDIKREPIIRRSGIRIKRREKGEIISYFEKLDEGMIGIINSILFENDIKNNPLYAEELKMVEKIKPWIGQVLEKKGYNEKQQKAFLSQVYTVSGAKDLLAFLESEKSEEEKIDYLWKLIERTWKESSEEKMERLERKKPEKEEPELVMAERTEEFKEVDELFKEIVEKSGGEFENRFQVLTGFAKAHFTGNLSPLRRMIERTLGEGYFRKIMEQFSGDK